MYQTRILGTGSYLPDARITNADIEKILASEPLKTDPVTGFPVGKPTTETWITERTGIHERRRAAPEQATSDLSAIAATRALEMAGMTAQDLQMIIVATVSPDQVAPSTACILQQHLGAKNIFCLDVAAACSGFIYALSIADQFIKTGVYKNALVVGAEVLTRMVDYKDRDTCILFGDGAGAMVLGRAEDSSNSKIFSVHLHADGSLGHLFEIAAGGSRLPYSMEVLKNGQHFMRMKGREIFKNAVRTLTECCQEALEANQLPIEKLDWLVPHQANTRILSAVADYFGIPLEKVVINIERTGNTSAATVPIAFDEAVRDGRIERGNTVLLAAFGAGLTSGSVLLKY